VRERERERERDGEGGREREKVSDCVSEGKNKMERQRP
jgi:hypothetical protein